MNELTNKVCCPCHENTPAISQSERGKLLKNLSNWKYLKNQQSISKEYKFKNFYQTIAFVNAVAWIANQEGHHPDMKIGYNHCTIALTTHAINNLSENDFICAAKIDILVP